MARETLGQGVCLICKNPADIRKNIKGKLYAYCAESCGLVQATGPGAQARFFAMLPAPPPDDIPGLDNPAGQVSAAAPLKKGFFSAFLDAEI